VTEFMGNRRDRGSSVLLFALALMLAVVSAVTTLTLLAIRIATNTGKFRDRAAAISAAEGQADVMVSRITAAVTAAPTAPSWPCSPIGAAVADSGPHSISATTTVKYYDSSGIDVGCPPAGTVVRSATVRSVATGPALPNTPPVRRVMETLLSFTGGDTTSAPFTALPRSMFSQHDVVFNNTVSVTQTVGAGLPSLYTNGKFSCTNNTGLTGDLVAQGSVSMTNSCTIGGSVAAGGTVNESSAQAKVGGNVVAVGDVNVIGGGGAVGGTIRTGGLAWWGGCTSTRCTANDPTVTSPSPENLPDLPWNADVEGAWLRAGWTVVKFENPADCNQVGGTNAPGEWLLNNSLVAGPKTLVRTTCPVSIGNNATIRMGRDVAVVADGGIAFNTSMRFRAAASRSFYLIQPTSSVAPGCTSNGITFNNNVTFDSTISLMLFTPCNIAAAQSLNVTGQLYAGGGLSFNNSVALQFRPMPMPIPTGSTTTVNPYTLQVTAKRENQ
jgi:hypothetical protein